MVNQNQVISYISFTIALLRLFSGLETTRLLIDQRKNKNKDDLYLDDGIYEITL
jgi:hypothetical protein